MLFKCRVYINIMINVVGAGPAGSFFSLNVKDEVRIFEEHKEVGKPIACTGILTSAITDLINVNKSVIVNRIKKVRLIAPNNDYCEFKLRNEEIIVYRDKFDQFLVEKALDKGVELYKQHRFLNFNKNGKLISEFETGKGKKNFSSDILVGADGSVSKVAQAAGLYVNRKNWVGKQYTANLEMEKDVFYVYFGDVPDFFGWVVPESGTKVRVGVASEKNVSTYFDILIKKLNLQEKDLDECQAGPIPMYNPKNLTSKDNVYLIGDAAGQVKATSVDFEESILYEKDEFIRTKKIGELIEEQMKLNKNEILTLTHPVKQKILKCSTIKAYSPDKGGGNLGFKNIKNIIKHKTDDDLYEIILEKGYRVKVTGSHSVMILGENSIENKKVVDISEKEDKLLVTINVPRQIKPITEINLLEFIMRELPDFASNVRIKKGKKYLYSKPTEIDIRYRSAYWGTDSIPLFKFIEKGIKLTNVGLSYNTKNIVIPNIVKVDECFCRLLGYYVAEGSSGDGKITLTFGKKDKDKGIVDDAINSIKSVFKIEPNKTISKINPPFRIINSYSVSFGGKLLSKIFSDVFGAGVGAKDKGVPFIIFNVKDKLKIEFLKGFIKGDGSIRIRKANVRKNWSADISIKTVSRKLASDLVLLSFQLGLVPSIEEFKSPQRILYGRKISASKGFKISYSSVNDLYKLKDIFPEKKIELLDYLSRISGKRGTYGIKKDFIDDELLNILKNDLKNGFGSFWSYSSYSYPRLLKTLEKNKDYNPKIRFLYNIVKNNIGVFSIKQIKKVKPTSKYVYDVEIPETQMFVGGIGPILLHNTGGGIVYGMRAGKILAVCLNNNLNYEEEWRKELNKDLMFHLRIRKFLNKFDERDYNEFVKVLKKIDLGNFNRDYPLKNLGMFMKPSLIGFCLKNFYKVI